MSARSDATVALDVAAAATIGCDRAAAYRAQRLFAAMARNAAQATAFFRIPPDRVFEVGSQIEL